MAQIVTITNPLTGQPAQVDQLDHTAQEIDDGIGFESTDYPGCYYRMVDGVVEWFNPPTILGIEYRTTERYLGKPVYVKIVDFGALPANSKKVVAHGIENLGYVLDYSGSAGYWVLSSVPWISNIEFTNTNIEITTNADEGAYATKVILKYFKYTD